MTALAAKRTTKSRNLGRVYEFPAAVDIIYAGGMVNINAAGFAEPAMAEASNGNVCGVAIETVDNSGGSAGTLNVRVQEGDFLFVATGTLAQTDVGAEMFASDDQTFSKTQASNEPSVGPLLEYVSATSGWVRVELGSSI